MLYPRVVCLCCVFMSGLAPSCFVVFLGGVVSMLGALMLLSMLGPDLCLALQLVMAKQLPGVGSMLPLLWMMHSSCMLS